MNSNTREVYGIVAKFLEPGQLLKAAKELHQQGYQKFDAYSPFPIHGIEKAMGLKQSVLPLIVFVFAVLGCSGALYLQWWINVVDYPLNISGKPFFSLPAFIPVTFELTILASAFATVLGMLGLNQLPRWNHSAFEHSQFHQVTDNGFFISVEATDKQFSEVKTANLLEKLGGTHIEIVKD